MVVPVPAQTVVLVHVKEIVQEPVGQVAILIVAQDVILDVGTIVQQQ